MFSGQAKTFKPMKIIILGAGQVGTSVAETLAGEANDITVVDHDIKKLDALKDRLDIRTVHGNASYPNVLENAGANDADLLIALSSSDEINMMACQVAYTLFHTPHKIARVRSQEYLERTKLFDRKAIPIDEIISPHREVTNHIHRLIKHPTALQVVNFADGLVQLVGVKAVEGGPLVGHALSTLREHIPSVDTRVAAIYRQNRSIIPEGKTVIEVGDEVFFIAAKRDIRQVISELRSLEKHYKSIMIVGGGNIGERLASELENDYQVKLLERSPERCEQLSISLDKTIVLQGDASDDELLLDENIQKVDMFCALTNNDEVNVMASLMAKNLGAGKVMTLINNPAYVDLMQGGSIDIAFSPQQITVGRLLRHVRQGDIVNVHSLRHGAAEAIEVIARGDQKSSKVVGRALENIPLPKGTTIGALVRDGQVIIAHDDVVVESEDHIILFLPDKKKVREVERLFQVGLGFF
ncbi:MAG: Trk system potassium transporter TrkA [Pseudomonadales bacterium]